MKRPVCLDLTYGVATDEIDLTQSQKRQRTTLRQPVAMPGNVDWSPVLKLVIHHAVVPAIIDSPEYSWKYLGAMKTVLSGRNATAFEIGDVNTAIIKDVIASTKEMHYRYLKKLPECPMLQHVPVEKGRCAGENYVMACMVKTLFSEKELEEFAAIIVHHYQLALDKSEAKRKAAENSLLCNETLDF
jgi:hypothetical protein